MEDKEFKKFKKSSEKNLLRAEVSMFVQYKKSLTDKQKEELNDLIDILIRAEYKCNSEYKINKDLYLSINSYYNNEISFSLQQGKCYKNKQFIRRNRFKYLFEIRVVQSWW